MWGGVPPQTFRALYRAQINRSEFDRINSPCDVLVKPKHWRYFKSTLQWEKSMWHSFYFRPFFGEMISSSQGGTIKEWDLNTSAVCPSSTVIRSVSSIDPRGRLIFYDHLHSAHYLAAFYTREFLPSFKLCHIIVLMISNSYWPLADPISFGL